MRPQDPNFPQEIPPIPPPRNRDDGESSDGPISPRLDASAEAVEEDDFSPAAANDSGHDTGSYASAGRDPDRPQPDQIQPSRDGDQTEPASGSTSSPASGSAPAAQGNGRAYNPDPAPWTDSDLQNVEDPLPQPTSEPQPTYTVRNQKPDSAAVPYNGTRPVPPAEDVWADTGIPYQPKELGVVDQLLLVLAEGVTLWKKGLRWVRSLLPPDLQRQLSDGVLTAIALGLLVLFLALWNPLGSGQKDRTMASEQPSSVTATAPDTDDRFAEPADNEQPAASEVVPVPEEPTPEQSLITDIQDRVSRISRSYGAGLIQSVEVNLPENTLGVNVAEAWYGLLTTQQDEVAQDIFAQAQGLKFGTLQLRDPEGVVVARNPVVGPNMIILRRQQSLDTDWRTE